MSLCEAYIKNNYGKVFEQANSYGIDLARNFSDYLCLNFIATKIVNRTSFDYFADEFSEGQLRQATAELTLKHFMGRRLAEALLPLHPAYRRFNQSEMETTYSVRPDPEGFVLQINDWEVLRDDAVNETIENYLEHDLVIKDAGKLMDLWTSAEKRINYIQQLPQLF